MSLDPAQTETPAPPLSAVPMSLTAGMFEIVPGSSPSLTAFGQEVYPAQRRGRRTERHVAILTGRAPLPRVDIFPALCALDAVPLQHLAEWSLVEQAGEERLALFLQAPAGAPLMRSLADHRPPMGESELLRQVVAPIAQLLKPFTTRRLFHGGIGPETLFVDPSGSTMLGECASAPAGLRQPVLLETIERGMTDPIARGPGSASDDLYALGATMALLLRGANPLAGLPDAEILALKAERGSYAVLTAGTTVPGALIEPMRAMLADDPRLRWSAEEFGQWAAGRRLSPRQPATTRRPARPFSFAGQEHWRPRSLAQAMPARTAQAIAEVESGELERWLKRTLGDAPASARLATATASAGTGGRVTQGRDERLVARVAMALDPAAPIRYRGLATLPTGFGPALAATAVAGGALQPLAELLGGSLLVFWYEMQREAAQEDTSRDIRGTEQMRVLLERPGLGYGIERVMYELSAALPCLSPLVGSRHVVALPALLTALEQAAAQPLRPSLPLDRHVVGFLAARDRRVNDMFLTALNMGSEAERAIAAVNLIATLQTRLAVGPLPGLAEWFGAALKPAVERLHARRRRKHAEALIATAARGGSLGALQRAVDDPKLLAEDREGFARARAEHAALEAEVARLRRDFADGAAVRLRAGREIASMIACCAAACGIVLTVLLRIAQS